MPESIAPFQATSTVLGLKPRTTASGSSRIRHWNEEIKKQALFSARTTRKAYLDELKKKLAAVSSRQTVPRIAKLELQAALATMGYTPQSGFKGDLAKWHGAVIPPARPGSITDLSSSRRINLILDTNVKQAISMGQLSTSENPMFLMINPAWRLQRAGARKKPRKDWLDRWKRAGASVKWKGALKGEFVALKDSPIWKALGEGRGGYKDTLGSDYPPFAFGSGMAWANVGRKEWKRLCDAEGVPYQLESIREKAKALKDAGASKDVGIGDVPFEGRVDSAVGITYRTEAAAPFHADESFRARVEEKVRAVRELALGRASEATVAADNAGKAKAGVDDAVGAWTEFASVVAPMYTEVATVAGALSKAAADLKLYEADSVRILEECRRLPTPVDETSQNSADARADALLGDLQKTEDVIRSVDIAGLSARADKAVSDARRAIEAKLKEECDKLVDEAKLAVDALDADEFDKIKDQFTDAKKKAKKEGRI